MLITHEREKLINLIIFISLKTRNCGKIKLFKLLYFIDFEHFKITGRSITGLSYAAWKMGPVPTALFDEINSPEPDMARALEFSETTTYKGYAMLTIKPVNDFDSSNFTKRELQLMQRLTEQYCSTIADEMIEATHLEDSPWDRVFNKENNKQGIIPYSYALRKSEKEEMEKVVAEKKQLVESLS
jgi:uncharacterized phage-associated protein